MTLVLPDLEVTVYANGFVLAGPTPALLTPLTQTQYWEADFRSLAM